jgi:hypothetical protein
VKGFGLTTGKETCFTKTKNHTTCDQALEVLDKAHASHDNAPRDNQEGKPDTRTHALEDHVGGNFWNQLLAFM